MSDAFASAVTNQAVAQIVAACGFKKTQASVLTCLSDVVKDYIDTIGTFAKSNAEHGGRTKVTIADMLIALEQLAVPIDWETLRSHAFNDDEINQRWYQPFPVEVPSFPVRIAKDPFPKEPRPPLFGRQEEEDSSRKNAAEPGASSSLDQEPRPSYVPAFLPPFPHKHTFRRTKVHAPPKDTDGSIHAKLVETREENQRSVTEISKHKSKKRPHSEGFLAQGFTGIENQGNGEGDSQSKNGEDLFNVSKRPFGTIQSPHDASSQQPEEKMNIDNGGAEGGGVSSPPDKTAATKGGGEEGES